MWKTIGFLIISSVLGLLVLGCENSSNTSSSSESKKVVTVGDISLYQSDISNLTMGMSPKDSIYFASRYIKSWIRNELLFKKAEMNLTEEELDVEQKVKSYRESLIINHYKQKYINQNLDTIVKKEEVAEYIKKYPENFKLSEAVFQFYFGKILSKNKANVRLVKKIFSKDSLDLTQDFNLESSTLLVSYDEDWYPASEILALIPESERKKISKMKKNSFFSVKNGGTTYCIKIKDKKNVGEISPAIFIFDKIKEIIIHKRKINLAKKIEYDIYEDAKKNNLFEIH